MGRRALYKRKRGNSVMNIPTTTTAGFVTNGASPPTVADHSGDVASVLRLDQGAVPFWRVELRHSVKLTAKETEVRPVVNANSAATAEVWATARYIKGGLTDDTIGVIPVNKTDVQFDVVMLAGIVAIDTAGMLMSIAIEHDSV